MTRKSAFHLACAKYGIALNQGKGNVPVVTAFPLCVRRKGHTFGRVAASIALRVWRWAKISS
jgi:hypothetical protein